MKIQKILPYFIIIALISLVFLFNNKPVKANELDKNIKEQVENLDLSSMQDFFDNIEKDNSINFYTLFDNLLNGEYDLDYNSVLGYIKNIFTPQINKLLPSFITIIAIGVFCAIINSIKSSFLSDGISEIIFFVTFLVALGIIFIHFSNIFNETKIVIENIAKLTEIMSPIILTLMVASGGNVSAGIYKPAAMFLSQGIITIILNVILNLIFVMTIFSVLSNFSSSVKLKKYAEFFQSIIKWIIGIIVTIFGIFLTVQGIASATFDGISIKAAKYAISNSVPLIGGFLKDGFDLVVAGSVIIKNSIGITAVFALFYLMISPLACFFSLNILLKFTSATLDFFGNSRISELCAQVSKSVSYLMVALLTVALMLFILVLLMIFSANAFI